MASNLTSLLYYRWSVARVQSVVSAGAADCRRSVRRLSWRGGHHRPSVHGRRGTRDGDISRPPVHIPLPGLPGRHRRWIRSRSGRPQQAGRVAGSGPHLRPGCRSRRPRTERAIPSMLG